MLRLVVNSLIFLVSTLGLGLLGVALLRRTRLKILRVLLSAGICLVITLGLAGALAEVAAHFVRDVPLVLRREYYQEYKPGWFAFRPNMSELFPSADPSRGRYPVITNEDGIRTSVHRATPETRAHERRVMFFGDSFTYGLGLREEDAMPRQAERILNEGNSERPWVAINAGMPGYNVLSSIELFDWLVDQYQPEVVVFTVGEVDDIAPDLSDRWRAGETSLQLRHLESFAFYRYFTLGRDWARYNAYFKVEDDVWDVRDTVLKSQLPRLRASIEKMQAAARRAGVRVVVNVLLETPLTTNVETLRPGRFTEMASFATVLRTGWDRNKADEILPADNHPNEKGARRLAQVVVPYIRNPMATGLIKWPQTAPR